MAGLRLERVDAEALTTGRSVATLIPMMDHHAQKSDQFATEQAGVRRAAGLAILLVVVVLPAAWIVSPGLLAQPQSDADRLAFVFRCELAIGLLLWAMIARVGAMRYFSADDIGGVTGKPEGRKIAVARAALQNSIEQTILALIAHTALALALPADKMAVIAAFVGLFIVGRIAYWFGYPRGAAARAFGFALTFYPTILALVATLVFNLV